MGGKNQSHQCVGSATPKKRHGTLRIAMGYATSLQTLGASPFGGFDGGRGNLREEPRRPRPYSRGERGDSAACVAGVSIPRRDSHAPTRRLGGLLVVGFRPSLGVLHHVLRVGHQRGGGLYAVLVEIALP